MAGKGFLQGAFAGQKRPVHSGWVLTTAFPHRRGYLVQGTAPSAHELESDRTCGQLQCQRRTATAAGPRGQN
ncbi:hypothetical protein ASPU41_14490 [Arthrobacter sp. U41]|nr:hypothetical protein ASPU41_14490 [Arthrobacter sp. U41]